MQQCPLHRLEAVWLLAGHDDMEAGRRIRRYTITDAGRLALAEARRALRELADEFLQLPARSRTMPRWVTLHYRVVVVEAHTRLCGPSATGLPPRSSSFGERAGARPRRSPRAGP
jgi:hypothetical protein